MVLYPIEPHHHHHHHQHSQHSDFSIVIIFFGLQDSSLEPSNPFCPCNNQKKFVPTISYSLDTKFARILTLRLRMPYLGLII